MNKKILVINGDIEALNSLDNNLYSYPVDLLSYKCKALLDKFVYNVSLSSKNIKNKRINICVKIDYIMYILHALVSRNIHNSNSNSNKIYEEDIRQKLICQDLCNLIYTNITDNSLIKDYILSIYNYMANVLEDYIDILNYNEDKKYYDIVRYKKYTYNNIFPVVSSLITNLHDVDNLYYKYYGVDCDINVLNAYRCNETTLKYKVDYDTISEKFLNYLERNNLSYKIQEVLDV